MAFHAMSFNDGAVRVRVPATSANLGPGFDALGLALSLYDDVDVRVRESGLSIEIEGEGADLAGAGEDHLVVQAMRKTFAACGSQPPGLRLRCVNRIPHGRGLGSSAAAIVAGILAARALAASGAGALLAATRDWLHQDYRAAAMPETAALVRSLRAAGIPAVVSGAGPSVLALLSSQPGEPDYRHYLDSLGSIVRETGIAWHISSLD